MKNMALMYEAIQKSAEVNGVTPEVAQKIIHEYEEQFIQSIIANGYALLTENLRVEIVPIQPRKYVLKGNEYSNTRSYKLKATISDRLYNRIRDKFDLLRDDMDGEGGYE